MQKMQEKGGIERKHGLEVYSDPANYYRAMKTLRERGWVDRAEAPPAADSEYIHHLTRDGELAVKLHTKQGGDGCGE